MSWRNCFEIVVASKIEKCTQIISHETMSSVSRQAKESLLPGITYNEYHKFYDRPTAMAI